MKTEITLIVEHENQFDSLADIVGYIAQSIPGVRRVEIVKPARSEDLLDLPVIEMPEEVRA